ncbi:D-glycero-beta-D-manno-heptose-7-phosphate kinase [Candidatus Zixiibacteriota bacterium]
MIEILPDRIRQLLDTLNGMTILIIGDVMLDKYVWGHVRRMSPEAPVPVVEVERDAFHLGGAANVASNVQALGAVPLLVGVVGSDDAATRELTELMESKGLQTTGLIEDSGRRTTVKTRIIAHQQHVVRADREDRFPVEKELASRLCEFVQGVLGDMDAVILQDYNKGVLSSEVLERLLPILRDSGVPVTVDPKFERFFDFKGVTLFKPNLSEVERALGTSLVDDGSVIEAAELIRQRLDVANVLITRGAQGMTLLEEDGTATHVGARARKVFDVSGAGDTVIATITSMLAAGSSMQEAAAIAGFAAGVVVGEVGAVPIHAETLLTAVDEEYE